MAVPNPLETFFRKVESWHRQESLGCQDILGIDAKFFLLAVPKVCEIV
jgi:hypothetical protein